MTAQVSHFIKFNNPTYNIVGSTNWYIFEPGSLGLKPTTICAAVWRG